MATGHFLELIDAGVRFSHKICFDAFSCKVFCGERVGIIGNNGCGKSALLAILSGQTGVGQGQVNYHGMSLGWVPQLIDDDLDHLSGAQRFQARLSQELALLPDILLLDEPTNHLDAKNRASLIRMINNFQGILFFSSHDEELLGACATEIWLLEGAQVNVFKGGYRSFFTRKSHSKPTNPWQTCTIEKAKSTNACTTDENSAASGKEETAR